MKMERKTKTRKTVNKAAIGLSLLMSSVLLVGNAVSVYAQPNITPDEENAINDFLSTQPANGSEKKIGTNNPIPAPITYHFPGIDNYLSAYVSRNETMVLESDNVYNERPASTDSPYFAGYKIKDWDKIVWYKVKNIQFDNIGADTTLSGNDVYFTKQLTLIKMDNQSEINQKNVVLCERLNLLGVAYSLDLPFEAEDPRFQMVSYYPKRLTRGEHLNKKGYWGFTIPISEDLPYDTIIKIDESLKANQIVIEDEGQFGKKTAEIIGSFENGVNGYNHYFEEDDYQKYTSDDVYHDVQILFNSVTEPDLVGEEDEDTLANTADIGEKEYPWGKVFGTVTFEAMPMNRVIRVGIDYTHYVTEDGTELKPTVYGLHDKEIIAGYSFIGTREEANGDKVHVYKAITRPTDSTPRTSDTRNLFSSAILLVLGMVSSIGLFIKRNKHA